jgi:glycosyltransferase involved in cell wall biosynthesis
MSSVLISAYACNPLQGSEEAVGWNWVKTAAQRHRVTVLTAAYHAHDIRSVCDPDANPRFVFVPHRPWHYQPTPAWKAIENSIAKPIMNFAYVAWQYDAFVAARKLAALEHFNLVHQLTYVGFRFPGHLWKLGLPFVWGPVGGLENTAWKLLPAMGAGGAAYYAARNLINSIQRRSLRSPRIAARAAGEGLIAATEGIATEMRSLYGVEATVISEVVAPIEYSPFEAPIRTVDKPLRIVWSGLHLAGKALNLLLEALARVPTQAAVELHILGDGPMRVSWQALASRLGVSNRCVWHGRVSREQALALMRMAHLLAITSLKDLTSTVLLEGLTLGLPVICPDHCGFSDVVKEGCGIKVDVDSREQLVTGFAHAIVRLESDERLRRSMGQAALMRARDFSGEMLSEKLEKVYMAVLSTPAIAPENASL